MSRRHALLVVLALLTGPRLVAAQDTTAMARAHAAYEALDYAGTIEAAKAVLARPPRPEDRIAAYELLGFAYGALDSTRAAVDAFRQLIFLNPDREPDLERVSPRITSLYASALGQVLVVRHVTVDSTSFIAGLGTARVQFEVSRAALTSTRIIGNGVDISVDTQDVARAGHTNWTVLGADGRPLPAGEYDIIVTAREAERNEYASPPVRVRVEQGSVDTLPLLTSLPGYAEQPEMVTPPRDWKPLAVSVLYAGLATAAGLALDQRQLGTGPRTVILSVGVGAVATGLTLSLRRPDPRPSPTNILYNRLLGELLARRNQEIAHDNATRRAQVRLTVKPLPR
jgi:tetratricopeptide (TPR) repeat protein